MWQVPMAFISPTGSRLDHSPLSPNFRRFPPCPSPIFSTNRRSAAISSLPFPRELLNLPPFPAAPFSFTPHKASLAPTAPVPSPPALPADD